eukprot:4090444-Prymnesium_polylepis.2
MPARVIANSVADLTARSSLESSRRSRSGVARLSDERWSSTADRALVAVQPTREELLVRASYAAHDVLIICHPTHLAPPGRPRAQPYPACRRLAAQQSGHVVAGGAPPLVKRDVPLAGEHAVCIPARAPQAIYSPRVAEEHKRP